MRLGEFDAYSSNFWIILMNFTHIRACTTKSNRFQEKSKIEQIKKPSFDSSMFNSQRSKKYTNTTQQWQNLRRELYRKWPRNPTCSRENFIASLILPRRIPRWKLLSMERLPKSSVRRTDLMLPKLYVREVDFSVFKISYYFTWNSNCIKI